MKLRSPLVAVAMLALAASSSVAHAKPPVPEDLLKGRVILSDKPLPTRWTSVSAYVSQLKAMNKTTLWYDKKTGKLTVEYAAFFANPVNDVQVALVLYDITGGQNERKLTAEQFMNRGDRVIFNSVTFDKEDIEMNRKYRIAIETRGKIVAWGEFVLRGQAENFSGRVNFTDDEAKQKD